MKIGVKYTTWLPEKMKHFNQKKSETVFFF